MTNQELIILKILLKKSLVALEQEKLETLKKIYEKALFYSEQDFVKKILLKD